jgi:epoxyqueuosine reductase
MPDEGVRIIEKAVEMGASMAGIATLDLLKASPSHAFLDRFGTKVEGLPAVTGVEDFGPIQWPVGARSALVFAVSHPGAEPHLDWFERRGNTPGNRLLIQIANRLSDWIEENLHIRTHKKNYYVEKGGIYLKDAAVLAGLGCVGINNLLITPKFGPRVRLRAMLLEAKLAPTGPIDFFPCDDCEQPCRNACPQEAFGGLVHSSDDTGMDTLPGLDGRFSRARCFAQMDADIDKSEIDAPEGVTYDLDRGEPDKLDPGESGKADILVKHCRICEIVCPAGLHTRRKSYPRQ